MKRTCTLIAVAGLLALVGWGTTASAYPVFAGKARPSGSTGFTIKPVVLETTTGRKISCTSYEAVYSVANEESMYLGLSGYTCTSNRAPCNSTSPYFRPAGQIYLEFEGALVYLDKAKHKVGVVFYPRQGSISLSCRGVGQETVQGSLVATIGPVNRVVTPPATFSLKLAQTAGVQRPLTYEGAGPAQSLYTSFEGGELEQTGLSFSTHLAFSGQLEIAG